VAVSTPNYATNASTTISVGAPWVDFNNAIGPDDSVNTYSQLAFSYTDELRLTHTVVLPEGSVLNGIRYFVRCLFTGVTVSPQIHVYNAVDLDFLGQATVSKSGLDWITAGSTSYAYGMTIASLAAGHVVTIFMEGDNDISEFGYVDAAYMEVTYTPPPTGNRKMKLFKRVRAVRRRGNAGR